MALADLISGFCDRDVLSGLTQDLSSMLVVKPDGECLSQSDAVVFVAA